MGITTGNVIILTEDRMMIKEGFLIPHKNNNSSNNTKLITILVGSSTRQALAQTSLNFLREYDRGNKNITIQWLNKNGV